MSYSGIGITLLTAVNMTSLNFYDRKEVISQKVIFINHNKQTYSDPPCFLVAGIGVDRGVKCCEKVFENSKKSAIVSRVEQIIPVEF